jgi:hypothetical protein
MTASNCTFEGLDRVPNRWDLFNVCFRLTNGSFDFQLENTEPEIREALECGGMSAAEIDFWFALAITATFHCERVQPSH